MGVDWICFYSPGCYASDLKSIRSFSPSKVLDTDVLLQFSDIWKYSSEKSKRHSTWLGWKNCIFSIITNWDLLVCIWDVDCFHSISFLSLWLSYLLEIWRIIFSSIRKELGLLSLDSLKKAITEIGEVCRYILSPFLDPFHFSPLSSMPISAWKPFQWRIQKMRA